jgi:hypothetical protein
MIQTEIDRAVAHATGESLSTIRRLGFLLADPLGRLDDADIPFIDWDELQAQQNARNAWRPNRELATA